MPHQAPSPTKITKRRKRTNPGKSLRKKHRSATERHNRPPSKAITEDDSGVGTEQWRRMRGEYDTTGRVEGVHDHWPLAASGALHASCLAPGMSRCVELLLSPSPVGFLEYGTPREKRGRGGVVARRLLPLLWLFVLRKILFRLPLHPKTLLRSTYLTVRDSRSYLTALDGARR